MTSIGAVAECMDCLLAIIAIGLPSLLGLCFYLLFCIAVLSSKKFRKISFYILAVSLGVSDMLMLTLFILYSTPATCISALFSNFSNSTMHAVPEQLHSAGIIAGMLSSLGWFSGLPVMACIAVDRYTSICKKELQVRIHSQFSA